MKKQFRILCVDSEGKIESVHDIERVIRNKKPIKTKNTWSSIRFKNRNLFWNGLPNIADNRIVLYCGDLEVKEVTAR